MSEPRLLTEEEIRGLMDGAEPGPWVRDGYDVLPARPRHEGWRIADCGTADSPDGARENAGLIAAAPDLAHTALEAMRRERILMLALADPDLCEYCSDDGCIERLAAIGPDGSRWCLAHAPAGSVRVVP